MLEIFNVTLPFFALVLAGYLAARARLLPAQAVPALNTFVLYFALPCLLFRFSARTPAHEIFNPRVFLAYATAGLALLGAFALIVRRAAGEGWREAAFTALAASWSNWGYMGFALVPALLGREALAPLVAAGMADLLLLVSAALALAGIEEHAALGTAAVVKGGLARIARNTLVWAVVLGGACSMLEIELPRALDQFTRLLGDAAGPVALFTIGVSLFRPGAPIGRTDVYMIAGAKLLLHPYLAALVAAYVFHLAPLALHTLVLSASLPVAGTAFVLAERHGANAERIAASILVSTAAAFFSFSAISWAFGLRLAG